MLRQDYMRQFIPGVWSPSLVGGGRREVAVWNVVVTEVGGSQVVWPGAVWTVLYLLQSVLRCPP